VISREESEKNRRDVSKRVWADVNTTTEVVRQSPEEIDVYSESGVQRLTLVGRGDMNHDHIEDVMLLSRDSVEGGSYVNFCLFVLTVNSERQWQLILVHNSMVAR